MAEHKTGTIEQAELIIKYCIENKIDIAHELLETVYTYKANLHKGPLTENTAEQVKFLEALATLNKLIKPVSIANLVVLEEKYHPTIFWIPNKKKLVSFADIILWSYRKLGLITFIILMMLQCYWLIGLSLRNDYAENKKRMDERL